VALKFRKEIDKLTKECDEAKDKIVEVDKKKVDPNGTLKVSVSDIKMRMKNQINLIFNGTRLPQFFRDPKLAAIEDD
jgi:hypothetical protein